MGKLLIVSISDHEEHIFKGGYIRTVLGSGYKFSSSPF